MKAAIHHASPAIEEKIEPVVESKAEPKIEAPLSAPEPEFVAAAPDSHTMPPMTHVPEPVVIHEPPPPAPPVEVSPASLWIPTASVPKVPESKVSAPAMWTENPRSTAPVENTDVPAFATFFDNSFEQYRQIVESLNKNPEPVSKPVRFEPTARESFLDFLAGR